MVKLIERLPEVAGNHCQIFTFGSYEVNQKSTNNEIKQTTSQPLLFGYGWKDLKANIFHNSKNDTMIIARFTGGDLDYDMRPKVLFYSAIILLEEIHILPNLGGVLTPGIAFNNTSLFDRLNSNGIKFEIIE
ncbi:mitochondrial saccharopine dehydrogenase-like oxidoreductase [Dinothrombium tinctorium]|uniref:Mitochondrial saccharopine dehydrogenase-like oxidoreductase n=1 Tax=Dinothrombium tinctorium TaxID=1965070 RepID=A0A3S3PU36_9ACAR|nr:mitochondrial saccharopine dehydrogenase-like oxidoreductase [Dinothrombium tinctorium]